MSDDTEARASKDDVWSVELMKAFRIVSLDHARQHANAWVRLELRTRGVSNARPPSRSARPLSGSLGVSWRGKVMVSSPGPRYR
jgi:hypothetical protein